MFVPLMSLINYLHHLHNGFDSLKVLFSSSCDTYSGLISFELNVLPDLMDRVMGQNLIS